MVERCLGLDIGGANIKVADTQGYARSWPFAMWTRVAELPTFLKGVLLAAPATKNLAVTMTGELADCFSSKSQGVQIILDAVEQTAAEKTVRVYQVDGNWATLEIARQNTMTVAAANWHALARFVTHRVGQQDILLVDVGSTTTDVIPIIGGFPETRGEDDVGRLLAGELVYTGVERSPVCALVDRIPYRDQMCPLAAELFATTLDVYLLLGDLPESDEVEHTGDGQRRSREAACTRLSRMICAESNQFTIDDAMVAAEWIAAAQGKLLKDCVQRAVSQYQGKLQSIVVSGHGDFLLNRALQPTGFGVPVYPLSETIGGDLSRNGPAHALAVLAAEEWVQ